MTYLSQFTQGIADDAFAKILKESYQKIITQDDLKEVFQNVINDIRKCAISEEIKEKMIETLSLSRNDLFEWDYDDL